MIDLRSVAEAVKLQFSDSQSMVIDDSYKFGQNGFVKFHANASYEIIGAFIHGSMINVVVLISEFNCFEIVFDEAFKYFEKIVEQEIIRKIPECKGRVNLFTIKNFEKDDRNRK